MRRAIVTGIAVLVAIAGVIGLIAFFNGRDSSTATEGAAQQSGRSVPVERKVPLLEAGNVLVRYSAPTMRGPLQTLAKQLGAPDTPALRSAGAAVVVRRDPGAAGIIADAYGRTLHVDSPSDERLQEFIETYLGQGSSG